jgi:hypothetical protein
LVNAVKSNPYAQAEAWEAMIRMVVLGFLFLSSLVTVGAALVLAVLNPSGSSKILTAALLIFGFLSFAVALGFRKVERLSWVHWVVVCVLAAPGALITFLR